MTVVDGFVDAVMASPLGVSWLAVLEAGGSGDEGWPATSAIADPANVWAAVDLIGEVPFGKLVEAAVFAAVFESGPWMGDSPAKIAAAYAQAERRAPIAEAVGERFGAELHAPIDHRAQQWFADGSPGLESLAPLFDRLDDVYGAGEFPIAGLWTATDPPAEALVEMVGAWEYETGPITRWWLPVRPEARVFEIHRPADWARLVTAHPRAAEPHPGWELPGVNQHVTDIAPLLASAHHRAARASVRRHVVPDWQSVANQYDGVHLSWAGFITSEGYIVDLESGDGDVTMLRYWFSERTLWLADAFGEPRAAPDPHISLVTGNHWPPLAPRIQITRDLVVRLLGRPPAT
ncbi:MAG TPA: hypothetical protein VE487_10930 [Ilumatobacter sp.]|nr:hypothetical protein [Ilumatobacter sp.]